MSKDQDRLKARDLRSQGSSIKQIAMSLGVSKGSVSFWVKDIILTSTQISQLKLAEAEGRQRGRLIIAKNKKDKRLSQIREFIEEGKDIVDKLTKNAFLIAGLSLYWAEGGKSDQNRRIEFCNSDPRMIQFLTLWLKTFLDVKDLELRADRKSVV